jgi:toxin YhaV
MSAQPIVPPVIHGWTLYADQNFLDQMDALIGRVEALRAKDPKEFRNRNESKRLAAISHLVFDAIPQDPTRIDYWQGKTLGDANKHWFRAKFFQQYRLFFRYNNAAKIIIYAWVNDEDTKRAYGSKKDAYKIFSKMLKSGSPPNDWESLLEGAKAQTARLKGILHH